MELTLLHRETEDDAEAAELLPFSQLRTSEKISKAVVAGMLDFGFNKIRL